MILRKLMIGWAQAMTLWLLLGLPDIIQGAQRIAQRIAEVIA